MDSIDIEKIVKWALVVFATGVIAGFGKLLAQWIVKSRRRKRDAREQRETDSAGAEMSATSDGQIRKQVAKSELKTLKKQRKAELKLRKKADPGGEDDPSARG